MEPEIRGEYLVSTDESRLDMSVIHEFLRRSYWAEGVPREIVENSCKNSLCFGLYHVPRGGPEVQVGFARVITDQTTFAYLADVFVVEGHRGTGLSKWLMRCVMSDARLAGLRRFMLATRDAHSLYARFGFKPVGAPEKLMEIARPGLYVAAASAG